MCKKLNDKETLIRDLKKEHLLALLCMSINIYLFSKIKKIEQYGYLQPTVDLKPTENNKVTFMTNSHNIQMGKIVKLKLKLHKYFKETL